MHMRKYTILEDYTKNVRRKELLKFFTKCRELPQGGTL